MSARAVELEAWVCVCERPRCRHTWRALDKMPDRCPSCQARTWNQKVARKAGRPFKEEAKR